MIVRGWLSLLVLVAAVSASAEEPRPATVSGRVADDCTSPVDNARVLLVRADGAEARPAIPRVATVAATTGTDSLGEFHFDTVAPGKYLVLVRPAGFQQDSYLANGYTPTFYPAAIRMADAAPIEVSAGQDVSGIAVTVSMSAMYTISGSVAVPDRESRQLIMAQQDAAEVEVFRGTLGPDGRFLIGGVPPGDYVLRALARDASQTSRTSEGGSSPALTTRIRVLDSDVTGIVLSR